MKCFVSATRLSGSGPHGADEGAVNTVSHKAAKVPSYDAVPRRALSLVKLIAFSTGVCRSAG